MSRSRKSRLPTANGKSVKIGLLHHAGGGNLGDEATQAAVIHNIKTRWPRASLVGITMNPDDTAMRHGIPSFHVRRRTWTVGYATSPSPSALTLKERIKRALSRSPVLFGLLTGAYAVVVRMPMSLGQELAFLVESFRIVRSLDLLIVNGGGQLTEWGGPWEFTYTVFKWVFLARLARVRCYVLNVGVGPVTRPLSRFFARYALRCADYVSFRDEESQALARHIGYTGDSQVFPDSAYSLDMPALGNFPRVSPRGKPTVGVAPMPYCDPRIFAEKDQVVYDDYIRTLARFTAQLVRQGCVVALLAGDIGVDPMAIDDLQEALRHEGITAACPSLTTEQASSTEELLSRMSALDYVVVCRFHGVVFAHLLNKPVLALSHHPKVAALMDDIGLSRYCVNIRTRDVELLADKFLAVVNDENAIKRRMAERLACYRARLTEQFDGLFPQEAL
jgi:polysaccharide pyruvyl transferase WcaK-like protein